MTTLLSGKGGVRLSFALVFFCCSAAYADRQQPPTKSRPKPVSIKVEKNPVLDHSGQPRHGQASYYGPEFHGRTMADGTPLNPRSNAAASRTLPLGTKAVVTNLQNGRSEQVEIRDRGPYIEGRIVDVTPRVAEKLDMKTEGVVPVRVTPIAVPMPDGSVKRGSAAESEALETASKD